MKLWTYHPSDFRIDDPSQRLDTAQGRFWKLKQKNFHYREVLPKLQKLVGEEQFLWCCTKRSNPFSTRNLGHDRLEWELDIPVAEVLAFIRSEVWDDLVWTRANNWQDLLLANPTEQSVADSDVDALVRFPLLVGCAKELGRVPTVEELRIQELAKRRAVRERNNSAGKRFACG